MPNIAKRSPTCLCSSWIESRAMTLTMSITIGRSAKESAYHELRHTNPSKSESYNPISPSTKECFSYSTIVPKSKEDQQQVSCTFQLQRSLLAKSHPPRLPDICQLTKPATFPHADQTLSKMKKPAIWNYEELRSYHATWRPSSFYQCADPKGTTMKRTLANNEPPTWLPKCSSRSPHQSTQDLPHPS